MSEEVKQEKKVAQKDEKKQKLVKMTRGDKVANVHPDEVQNYIKGNWVK
jgi:hypothetical protein